MANKHITIKNQKISFYGTPKEIDSAISVVETLALTGVEAKDRLVIQEALKNEPCFKKHGVLYRGNTVYPFEPIVKEFKRLMIKGTLSEMSDKFYQLLAVKFDIAHYNKMGFAYYYHNSFEDLWEQCLSRELRNIPDWYTDLQKIADELLSIKEGK